MMGHLIGKAYSQEHLLEVAKNIVLAVHKAPQITGRTAVETEIVWGEDLEPILECMEQSGRVFRYVQADYETMSQCYDRGEPPVVVFIGASVGRSNLAWNCGACGFDTCKEFNTYSKNQQSGFLGGPSCNWKALDYGISCDWACAAAWHYKVDNRIMGSVAAAANFLNYLPNSNAKIGLALGPPRDLVYYNREEMHKVITYEMDKMDMLRTVPAMFCAFPGGGNPLYKTSDRWWERPEFQKMESSEEAMGVLQDAFFVKIPEIVKKYGEGIAARYK